MLMPFLYTSLFLCNLTLLDRRKIMIHSQFTKLFLFASLWNLVGALFGYFNTAFTFEIIFNKELIDPLLFTVYKGAWGTTLTYFIGYLFVAYNPEKHYGIVVIGAIGKFGFIISLLQLYFAGIASSVVFVIIIGDGVFLGFFLYYFFWIYKRTSLDIDK